MTTEFIFHSSMQLHRCTPLNPALESRTGGGGGGGGGGGFKPVCLAPSPMYQELLIIIATESQFWQPLYVAITEY